MVHDNHCGVFFCIAMYCLYIYAHYIQVSITTEHQMHFALSECSAALALACFLSKGHGRQRGHWHFWKRHARRSNELWQIPSGKQTVSY